MLSKTVFLLIALLTFAATVGADDDDKADYEPADGICTKCNCTSANETLENGENGRLFTLDCSMKSHEKLFANWPEEMGANHTGMELVYIMSLSNIKQLPLLPPSDALILFTCRHCKIKSIVSHAFIDTPNIVFIDLSFNEIMSEEMFPEIFRGPDSDLEYSPIMLEVLDLSHNHISYFEKIIFEHTPNLKKLDVSYNPFNQFDSQTEKALASLHKLEILDLSHTGIMELPTIFEHMSQLSELFLSGNKFITVPDSISTVGSSLKYLRLNENPIEVIDVESFIGLSKLTKLNISALPNLTSIKADSFKHLVSLEVLHCRSNPKLSSFDMANLRMLKHLKELDVSNNALQSLDFGQLVMLEPAENTEPSSEAIDKRFEDQFKQLRVLRLAGNPWNCDCSMMRSLSLFDHKSAYFNKSMNEDDARCKTPEYLLSKLLYRLPNEFFCAASDKQKPLKIPVYDPPQFLRPKSIMLTVFSVVGVVILGIIIGFAIVCIKQRLKSNDEGYASSPIRYTTVRDSTISNIANSPYNP